MAAGIRETMYEGIKTGQRKFSSLIKKMKKAGITVVYFGGLYTEAGPLMRQMADQGLRVTFIGADGIVSNELVSIAGDALDGTLLTFSPDPRIYPDNKDLVEKFRAAGFEPEAYTLYAYAAVQAIAGAAKAAGENDPRKVAEALKTEGPFKTALGDVSFDEKGDSKLPGYVFYEWKKGEDGKYYYSLM